MPFESHETDLTLPADADRALRDLAATYRERLQLFAMRRVGDAATAADVAQEVLRRVSAALTEGRIENLAAMPGFVFQTARHVCLHRVRSEIRETKALHRLASDPSLEPPPAPDPLTSLISEEQRRTIREALAQLDVADRTLLEALYFHHREPLELAREMHVTAEAFRVRKHRAIKRLAALIDPAISE